MISWVLVGFSNSAAGLKTPGRVGVTALRCESGVKTSLEVTDMTTTQPVIDVPDLRVSLQREQLEQLRLEEQLELEDLRRKVPDLEARVRLSERSLEREQKEFHRDRKGLQQLLYDQRQRHSGLMSDQTNAMTQLEKAKNELVTKIHRETERNEALSSFNKALKRQVTALLRDTHVLEKRIFDKVREVASLTEDSKRLQRAAAETELKLQADHKIFKRTMDRNMAEKDRQMRTLEREHEKSLKDLGKEIEVYKRELEDAKLAAEQAQQHKTAAEEVTAQVMKEKDILLTRAKDTETELNSLKARVQLLSSRANELEEQIHSLEGRLTNWSFLGRQFLVETGRRIKKLFTRRKTRSAQESWNQALDDITRIS